MKRLAILVAALVGCRTDPTGGSVDGATIFQGRCASCHGPTGKPDAVMVARLNVRDLTAPEMRARITPELVANQIRTGSKNGLMPALGGGMSKEQIDAVSAYVASPAFLAPR